jgi:hypothetical protein
MVVTTEYVDISLPVSPMRTFVAAPRAESQYPGIWCYSDIFQLTPPLLRTCVRLSDMLARRYPRGTAGRAVSVTPKKLAWTLILILGILGLNSAGKGCHSQKSSAGSSIEFTSIPPAAQGSRGRVDTISGRVRNARPKQQIVIYSHNGPWWVQPWPPYLGS